MKNQNRKIRNVEKLRALATKLAAEELLTATNEGTYSSADAARVCGTGDPRYTTLRVYELVGGGKRYEGPVGNGMPGRLRALNQQELKQKRWELRDLRAELREELKQLSEEASLVKDAKATIDDILVARERLRAQLDGRYGEDALQAAMVRAIVTKARPSKTHAEAWLRLVTHHEAARVKLYIRRHWVLREADLHCVPGIDEKRTLAALVAPEPQPETFRVAGEALSAEELMPILEAVLATLPQRDRDFLLGYEQSARSPRTGRRANADRVRAHRLRARVRAAVTSRVEQPLLHA